MPDLLTGARMRYNSLQKKVFEVDAEITKHSNDVIMKAMAETFKDKTLKIFGLDSARITGVIPTVLPARKEGRFLLAWHHFPKSCSQ